MECGKDGQDLQGRCRYPFDVSIFFKKYTSGMISHDNRVVFFQKIQNLSGCCAAGKGRQEKKIERRHKKSCHPPA
jgi:hypothetical protein